MPSTTYRGRRAVAIENAEMRLTVLEEGGHIAEMLDKQSGVNPLWTPPWPSIEPSTYDPVRHPEYGLNAESRLLSGIMGHNLCMDIFGGPSDEEAAAGLSVHGEASVAPYTIAAEDCRLTMSAALPQAQMEVRREIVLDGATVRIHEEVENLSATDRPIGWTEHVTLGPPFLAKGQTQFRASATQSKVFESDFTGGKGYMKIGAEFEWPFVPRIDTGTEDLRVFPSFPVSGGYTTHLMDPLRDEAFFVAFSPQYRLAIGYAWRRTDFPWLGIWEENCSRDLPPWNGQTLTRGMEFGASPMPESRRSMIERGSLFGVPGFRWIPARSRVAVDYRAVLLLAGAVPDSI